MLKAFQIDSLSFNRLPGGGETKEIENVKHILSDKKHPVQVPQLRRKHCEMMDQYMGVMRSEAGMKTMLQEIHRACDEDLANLVVSDKSLRYNFALRDALEMTYRLALEEMSTRAALLRTESRGSHYREDFPARNDKEWVKNIVFYKSNGELKMDVRTVDQSIIRIEEIQDYANNDSPWH